MKRPPLGNRRGQCRGREALRSWASLGLLLTLFQAEVFPQARVDPVWATAADHDANVDSCAVWVAPDPGDSLLFVTEKDGDRLQVRHATTGEPYATMPYLGDVEDGTGPGEFNRPNGVWVVYHVPHAGGFSDVLIVTDQRNERVQILRLPELEYFGEFGTGEVGKGYGLAPYHDGTDFFVFVTDQEPPSAFPGKLKKYRMRPAGDLLGADLVLAAGEEDGEPSLHNVESIVADRALNRLHVCGDEGGDQNRLFTLDGTYTGIDYGDPQFEADQEGINLYLTGETSGYLVVSDQLQSGSPNEFEIFDRQTLASRGYFASPSTGALVTRNTDGAFLEQRPLPGFPDGAFYAVNDDRNVHAFDWTDVAEALGLELAPLDRPFGGTAVRAGPSASRAALWFHDGSWWGALEDGDGLVAARLQSGTFVVLSPLEGTAPALARATADNVLVLSAGGTPQVQLLEYRPALREYGAGSPPVALSEVQGTLVDMAVEERMDGGPRKGWILWVSDGTARVTWSGTSPGGVADFSTWGLDGSVSLGAAANVAPRLLHVPEWQSTVALWADTEDVVLRAHSDGDIPESWQPGESVVSGGFGSIAAAPAPGGRLFVLAREPDGACRIRMRAASAGAWTDVPVAGPVGEPALVVDPPSATLHLLHSKEVAGRRVLHGRQATLETLDFGPDRYLAGWPGVDLGAPVFPAEVPSEACDLVVACLGDDARGYFGRVALTREEDLQSPVTFGHSPPPGAEDVEPGTRLSFRITDALTGVDRESVRVFVNDLELAPTVRGVPGSTIVEAELPGAIVEPEAIIRIHARDLASPPNVMTPFEYVVGVTTTDSPVFLRGEINGDGGVDISDAVVILLALFEGSTVLACEDSADVDDSGDVNITDAVRLLSFLFLAGTAPVDPFPTCGQDATGDALPCSGEAPCP